MNLWEIPLFRVLVPLTSAASLFVIGYVAAESPAPDGKRLGLRGLKRRRALQKVPLWPLLEPVLRWTGARVSGLISEKLRRDINRRISLAGDFLGLLPEEVVGLSAATCLVGLSIGWMFGSASGLGNILMLAGGALGAAFPYNRISSTGSDRRREIDRRLPQAIDLLALCMSAGLDFPGAVRQVVEKSGSPDDPVIEEFTLILQGLQLGHTRRQALEEFAERAPAPSVFEFVGAVVQAELRGNPLLDVLRIQADISRRKRTVRAEESAAKAGVAMMGPMVMVFICILILIVAPIVMKVKDSGI